MYVHLTILSYIKNIIPNNGCVRLFTPQLRVRRPGSKLQSGRARLVRRVPYPLTPDEIITASVTFFWKMR